MVPRGLHLIDEPEAALSPHSQLAMLALMAEMVRGEAQFIIATHSPILMAFPGARIYSFDSAPVQEVAYEDLEHVAVTRDFLVNPERFLRHLLT
jgi:predicted ATPase